MKYIFVNINILRPFAAREERTVARARARRPRTFIVDPACTSCPHVQYAMRVPLVGAGTGTGTWYRRCWYRYRDQYE